MKRTGIKASHKNFLGGKRVNQALKIGSKTLGYIGDMALPAAFIAPAAVPALEAAKATSVALGLAQKGRQMIKHKKIL